MTKALHFTIGPVQGFIADARRTRDLWAGSFILSWLSGKAMEVVYNNHGTIVFPDVENDSLFNAIKEKRDENTPYVGSLPNRFKATFLDDKDVTNVAKACTETVQKKWKELAEAVYNQFVAPEAAGLGLNTREIWDRQIDNFWEINWVVGTEGGDHKWLDLRKNWRHYQASFEETGDLCRLMGRFQEISGYPKIGHRKEQNEFYKKLSESKYEHQRDSRKLGSLNIGEDERLCAIALVKRLFPLLNDLDKIIGWRPGGDAVNVVNWPAVNYVAALPWLDQIDPNERKAYEQEVEKCAQKWKFTSYKGEIETRLYGFEEKDGIKESEFYSFDGLLFHKDGIAAWNIIFEKEPPDQSVISKLKARLTEALSEIKGPKTSGSFTASEFYAVLLMDGDRIGTKVADNPDKVKEGLATFTQSVIDYFNPNGKTKNKQKGMLIYAGGDDVLAIFPVDTVITAAMDLQKKYTEAFSGDTSYTISAAIVFAQYQIPLRTVLNNAHDYLDKVAKDRNGRDSLAIAVLKPGGIASDWVSRWGDTVVSLLEIGKDRSDYSSSFFYNLKQRYQRLFGDEDDPQSNGIITKNIMRALIKAEYRNQPGKDKLSDSDVERAINPIMDICYPVKCEETGEKKQDHTDIINFDAVLVARFLSEEGRWKKAAPDGTKKESAS